MKDFKWKLIPKEQLELDNTQLWKVVKRDFSYLTEKEQIEIASVAVCYAHFVHL